MICCLILYQNEDPIPAGGQIRKVQLVIKDDQVPEPDEVVLVYLTDATGGARVATDSDSGLRVSDSCDPYEGLPPKLSFKGLLNTPYSKMAANLLLFYTYINRLS